jgi:hypothetical protein
LTYPISQTIPSGGYVTIWSNAGDNRYVDAGDYIRLSTPLLTISSLSGTSVGSQLRLDVDYMRYGTSGGIDSQLWGLIWTQSSAIPAPTSSSQYMKRDTEGSFASVDTGDAGDWSLIPELPGGSIVWAVSACAPALLLVVASRRLRPAVERRSK